MVKNINIWVKIEQLIVVANSLVSYHATTFEKNSCRLLSLSLCPSRARSPCRPTPPPPPAPLSSLGSRPAAAGHQYRHPSHLPCLNRTHSTRSAWAIAASRSWAPGSERRCRQPVRTGGSWDKAAAPASGRPRRKPWATGRTADWAASIRQGRNTISVPPSLNHLLPVPASPRFPPALLSGHDQGCASPPPRPWLVCASFSWFGDARWYPSLYPLDFPELHFTRIGSGYCVPSLCGWMVLLDYSVHLCLSASG
jgi:hypothetical protein